MTRKQQIEYYQSIMTRIETWAQREHERIRQQILVRHFDGNGCCLHNWMLNYEQGRSTITKEVYKLGKLYNYKEQQIWRESKRLKDHFYSKLIAAYRLTA